MKNLIQFFQYRHLPENLQTISEPYCELAEWMKENLPENPESTVAMRKLLEAKDCAVRSILFK